MPKVSEDHLTALSTYAPRVSAFTPLRYRDFRLLWTGLVIANIGSWMQFVALGYLVDRLTKEPLYLGILAASQAVPRLLFALVGGTIADRVDRRRVLVLTNLLLMGSATALAVLTATGLIQVWQIMVLAAVNSLAMSFDMPARHSMLPELVGENQLLSAVGLSALAYNGAGIFGPSLGGVIIAAVGEAGCFALNAVSYIGVLLAVMRMRIPPSRAAGHLTVSQDVREGLRLLFENRRLLLLLGAVWSLSFFGRPYVQMMPAFAREVLMVDARGLGVLQAAAGMGTIASVLLLARLSAGRGIGAILGFAMLAFGALVTIFGLTRWFWLALGLLVLIGAAQALALASANTLIQLAAPPFARGRMMGFYSMMTFGGFALGSLPVGAAAGAVGVGPALSAGGALVITIAIAILPQLRRIE
ncbi:MAG TPA: MFS transporter [Thermoleophilia bacterium]|nr:MFS transporter [Thermoleophilia bacterium]